MKDRKGLEYEELKQRQAEHLTLWATKIQPELFAAVSKYVLQHNKPAITPEDLHHVWRGQDLIEIIRQWPNLQSPYPKPCDVDEV